MRNKFIGVSGLIFFLLHTGMCEYKAPTYLIDIPSAYSSRLPFTAGINLTLPIGKDTLCRQEMNVYIEAEIPKGPTIGLSLLTPNLAVMGAKYTINRETSKVPAIAIGVEYITPYKWVSPIGKDKEIGWADDLTYLYRNPEQFSFFVVATKDLGPYGTYTLGLGRGTFVGYGPRSRRFNTDVFTGTHSDNAIGMIWGVEFPLVPPLCGTIDFDGRDYNMGFKFKLPYFQIGAGVAKLEHRLGGLEWLYPRLAFGFTFNYLFIKRLLKRPTGVLIVSVRDMKRGQAKRAIITFPGTALPPVMTGSGGSCSIKLEPGSYWVRAGIPGYFWADREIYVGEGQTTLCHFEIRSIVP
jgi:hypothetical protein